MAAASPQLTRCPHFAHPVGPGFALPGNPHDMLPIDFGGDGGPAGQQQRQQGQALQAALDAAANAAGSHMLRAHGPVPSRLLRHLGKLVAAEGETPKGEVRACCLPRKP